MTLPRTAVLFLVVLAVAPAAVADGPSLEPLGKLAEELSTGLGPFLAGGEPAASWSTAVASAKSIATVRDLTKGATGGTVYSLELALAWEKEGQVVYQVDLALFLGAGAPTVLALAGKSVAGEPGPGFRPLKAVGGAQRPIGEAAQFLAQALASGAAIPYATSEPIAKLLREDPLTKARALVEKAPKNAAMVKAILAAREPDGCRVRIGVLRFAVLEGDLPRGLLAATLSAAGDKLGLELGAFDGASTAWESWYPKDTTPPGGTQYPCAFTALPKDLVGIAEGDRHYIDHAYGLVVRAIHAKLLVLKVLGQSGGNYDAAAATYQASMTPALAKLKAEPIPAGLEAFHAGLVAAFDFQVSFFAEAAVARKAGKTWDQMMAIPSGRAASKQLFAAWAEMERRYPKWSPAVKDSIYHHLCALDLF